MGDTEKNVLAATTPEGRHMCSSCSDVGNEPGECVYTSELGRNGPLCTCCDSCAEICLREV